MGLVEIIMITSFILSYFISFVTMYIYLTNKYKKINNQLNAQIEILNKQIKPQPMNLSFETCNSIIDDIIQDIWANKYFLNYRLRDLTIIPSMDEEIASFIKEVTEALSPTMMEEILKYYTYEYMIKRITRKSQMLFIEYTKNFKPSTK